MIFLSFTLPFGIGPDSAQIRAVNFVKHIVSLFYESALQTQKRAEHRDAVRQRIVDAAIKLHQTIGPERDLDWPTLQKKPGWAG